MRQEVNSRQQRSESLLFSNSEEPTSLWATIPLLIIVSPSTSKDIGEVLLAPNRDNKEVHCRLQVHTFLSELVATEISTLQRTIL